MLQILSSLGISFPLSRSEEDQSLNEDEVKKLKSVADEKKAKYNKARYKTKYNKARYKTNYSIIATLTVEWSIAL